MDIKVRFSEESMSSRAQFNDDASSVSVQYEDVLKGDKGEDGVSPVVTMSKVNGKTTLVIVDAYGSHTTEILDGDIGVIPVDNHTIVMDSTGALKVNTTNDAEEDNTRPITSAGAYTLIGNIEAVLSGI